MVKTSLLILILVLSTACGKEVEISNKKLEYNSSLSTTTPEIDGTLIRGTPDRLQVNNGTYQVSMYSSYDALEFIATRQLNKSYTVRFRGKIKSNQYVVETMRAK
jgi:hypothetical protein